jgi:type IV pilus assembly protein PilY1
MATFPIAIGTDDAMETGGTTAHTGNGLTNDMDATTDWFGLRFQTAGAGPPQGATITAATFAFTASAAGADEPEVTIYGELSVSSATFTNGASNISSRARTTATHLWDVADYGASVNSVHSTTDFSNVVQELVNQASWTTSSPITILGQGSANTGRDLQFRFFEYQGTGGTDPQGTYSAVLTLTWTGGGVSPIAAARHYRAQL